MLLLPYCEIDGIRTVPDSVIHGLFDQMIKDRTLKRVFFDGGVQKACDLVRTWRACETYFVVDSGKKEIASVIWLTDHHQRTAYVHWVIFSAYWGQSAPIILETALTDLFSRKNGNGEFEFDALFGMVPETNRLGVKLVEKCRAMKIVGTIPLCSRNFYTGALVGAVFVCMTRG